MRSDGWVSNVAINDLQIGRVVRQVVIELAGNLLNLWQTRPRHFWEVVVLVVIANVEIQQINGSIIRISFNSFDECIVLCDEMTCYRVQTHAQ